jgi:hypothetical protein
MDEETSNRRGMTLKDWAQIAMLTIAIAGIFWRGGQFMAEQQYTNLMLAEMRGKLDSVSTQQAQDRSDLRVLQERYQALEGRVTRSEAR